MAHSSSSYPLGKTVLAAAAAGVNDVLGYGSAGIEFLFGGLVQPKMFEIFGNGGFVFAVRVLPAIIFVTALISALYYIGDRRWIVLVLGMIFQKLLGVSKIESFSAVTTIFLGQSEMPAVVKPFMRDMSNAELFAVRLSGWRRWAGSVLAGYARSRREGRVFARSVVHGGARRPVVCQDHPSVRLKRAGSRSNISASMKSARPT